MTIIRDIRTRLLRTATEAGRADGTIFDGLICARSVFDQVARAGGCGETPCVMTLFNLAVRPGEYFPDDLVVLTRGGMMVGVAKLHGPEG